MIIYLSLLVSIVGLLMYALSTNPKVAEIGRIMFGVGLLCFLLNDTALINVIQRR